MSFSLLTLLLTIINLPASRVVKLVTNLLTVSSKETYLENGYGNQKFQGNQNLTIKDPRMLWVPKRNWFLCFAEKCQKIIHKGYVGHWQRLSRNIMWKKENFKSVQKIDGGFIRFSDNAKGEVVWVGTITISPTYDVIEVYVVDELRHNLLSIIQLCDACFQVYCLTLLNAPSTIPQRTSTILVIELRISLPLIMLI